MTIKAKLLSLAALFAVGLLWSFLQPRPSEDFVDEDQSNEGHPGDLTGDGDGDPC